MILGIRRLRDRVGIQQERRIGTGVQGGQHRIHGHTVRFQAGRIGRTETRSQRYSVGRNNIFDLRRQPVRFQKTLERRPDIRIERLPVDERNSSACRINAGTG